MIRIQQLKLPVSHTEEELIQKIAKMLGIRPQAVLEYRIRKQSVDARRKKQVSYVYTADVKVQKEAAVLKKAKSSQISSAGDISYEFSVSGTEALAHPPVVKHPLWEKMGRRTEGQEIEWRSVAMGDGELGVATRKSQMLGRFYIRIQLIR